MSVGVSLCIGTGSSSPQRLSSPKSLNNRILHQYWHVKGTVTCCFRLCIPDKLDRDQGKASMDIVAFGIRLVDRVLGSMPCNQILHNPDKPMPSNQRGNDTSRFHFVFPPYQLKNDILEKERLCSSKGTNGACSVVPCFDGLQLNHCSFRNRADDGSLALFAGGVTSQLINALSSRVH